MKKLLIPAFTIILVLSIAACGDKGPHEHNYLTKKVLPATCMAEGEKLYVCECGDNYTETSPKLDHKFGEWEVTAKPTHAVTGTQTRKCSECDTTEEKEIPVLSVEDFIKTYAGIMINMPEFKSTQELSAGSLLNWVLMYTEATESNWDDKTFQLTKVYSVNEIKRITTHYFGVSFDYETYSVYDESITYREYDDALIWVTGGMGGWPNYTADTVTKIDDTHYTLRYAGTQLGETQPYCYGTLTLELKEDRFVILSHSKE